MKRRLTLCLCMVMGFGSPALANSFQRLDVFALQWVSDAAISPDGRDIVYVRHSMDIMRDRRVTRLWRMSTDGRVHQPIGQVEANQRGPVWSPTGDRVAFVQSTDQGAEIYLYWPTTGAVSRLSQLPHSPGPLSFSSDGERLAFPMLVEEPAVTMVKPPESPTGAEWAPPVRITTRLFHEADGSGRLPIGNHQYFVIPTSGGQATQVTRSHCTKRGKAAWVSDDSQLIFSANCVPDAERRFRNSEIYSADINSGAQVALTQQDGPDRSPVVSPNGEYIAYWRYKDRRQAYQVNQLVVMRVDGTEKRALAGDLDRRVDNLHWRADSRAVFLSYDSEGSSHIAEVTLRDKRRVLADNLGGESIGRPYSGGSFTVSNNGRIAFSFADPMHPAELGLATDRGRVRKLTDLSASWSKFRQLGRVEEVNYRASTDDLALQGWLVYPPNHQPDKAYPLIVEIHGGPISHYGPFFSPEIQLLAAAGYVVFYPNARGSTSYGEAFGNLLYHNYPGDDITDIMDGVSQLIELGIADESRLYITGGSAGGTSAAWLIADYHQFQAAAVVKPVMNWVSKTLTADNHFWYADYRYPGQPWDSIEAYMRFSPVSKVGDIRTPTLVMVGTDDLRTPVSEARQLYHALRLRGVDTAMVELPGASHFIARRPSQLIAKIDHILEWFSRYPDAVESDITP